MKSKITKSLYLSLLILPLLLAGCNRDNSMKTYGYIKSQTVLLSSSQGGQVEKIYVKANEPVEAAASLVQLKSDIQANDVLLAEAQARTEEAQMQQYRNSRSSSYQAAKARLLAAKANVTIAKQIQNEQLIAAPVNGKVYKVLYKIGERVPPYYPVVELTMPGKMDVVFYIPEKALNRIQLNREIKIYSRGDKKTLTGTITAITEKLSDDPAKQYKEGKLSFKVTANVHGNNHLKPGDLVKISYGSTLNK